eukprot:CAMPEP_0185855648 /NCGR_PEP_ID=MMETSP1354-20130828/26396_1 /TAXON_ID=708628 /ORGANISM="Erythrolobus madagascarensis, Strain CCMP3276" /LENGTH=134 /DNA_ID=CAMNT_0028557713 /DNA_START=37 /DNA_END=437 /DNA_ORIENTATION=+
MRSRRAQASRSVPRDPAPVVDPALREKYKVEVTAINVLTLALVFVFLTAGSTKITGLFAARAHYAMVLDFQRYVAALKLQQIGMDDVSLRVFVGIHEMFLAVALLTTVAVPAACALGVIMMGAIFTHAVLRESP